MRVLIYVEPHPIRGSQTIFNDVARRFLPLLRGSTPEFDVRMYTTQAVVGKLGDEAIAPVKDRLIRATPAEETAFAAAVGEWEPAGIEAWLSLMAGGEIADSYVQVLRRIWHAFPFDIIVHWGENGAVTRFLDERDVTRLAMELGCTRNPFLTTVIMDPFGTNGSAIVPRLSVEDLREIVGDRPMSAAEAIFGYSADGEALPYEHQFAPIDGGDLTARILSSPKKIAFLPLQLHDDANLLRFSKYDTVEEVVLDVVPQLAEAGYLTIVKTHPDAKTRHGSRVAFTLAKSALRPWMDSVIWLDATQAVYSNSRLISMADLVLTVNSSVGFESLFFDKAVCVLGDAVYKPQGLFPELGDAISESYDKVSYQQGIGLLRRFMLGGYMVAERVRGNPATFQHMALTIDAVRRCHGHNPAAIAQQTYQIFSVPREHEARSAMAKGRSVPGSSEFGIPKVGAEPHPTPALMIHDAPSTVITDAARRLLGLSQARDFETFHTALVQAFNDQDKLELYIRVSGIVDEKYYLNQHRDVARAGVDPVTHFARSGLREGRAARTDLAIESKTHLREQLEIAAESLIEDGLIPRFPLSTDMEDRRQKNLAAINNGLRSRGNKVVVVAHLFYRHLVPELLRQLTNIAEAFDLVVTMPDWGNREIVAMVQDKHPEALFYPCVNRGRDVGPLLDLLPSIIKQGYEVMLHLHTRASVTSGGRVNPDLGALLRDESLKSLVGSPERVTDILQRFRQDPALNMVGPEPHYLPFDTDAYHDRGAIASTLLGAGPGDGFFADTMFWARPSAFRDLIGPVGLSMVNFDEESGTDAQAISEMVGRMFSHAAVTNGGTVIGAPLDPTAPLVSELAPTTSPGLIVSQRIESGLLNRLKRTEVTQGALAW